MDPCFVVFQFDNIFQLLSGVVLLLLLISFFRYSKLLKVQQQKLLKLDSLIKEIEKRYVEEP